MVPRARETGGGTRPLPYLLLHLLLACSLHREPCTAPERASHLISEHDRNPLADFALRQLRVEEPEDPLANVIEVCHTSVAFLQP